MRRVDFVVLMALAVLANVTFNTPQAAAMATGAMSAGLQSSFAETKLVLGVSCFRNGWRGWSIYDKCEKHIRKKRRKGMPQGQ